jgi:hypothetical protein
MKKFFVFLALTLVFAVGLSVFTPTIAAPISDDENIRVWVEFQPGKKGVVQAALKGNGAQFHFTFEELNSFVVTLPTSAIRGLN